MTIPIFLALSEGLLRDEDEHIKCRKAVTDIQTWLDNWRMTLQKEKKVGTNVDRNRWKGIQQLPIKYWYFQKQDKRRRGEPQRPHLYSSPVHISSVKTQGQQVPSTNQAGAKGFLRTQWRFLAPHLPVKPGTRPQCPDTENHKQISRVLCITIRLSQSSPLELYLSEPHLLRM